MATSTSVPFIALARQHDLLGAELASAFARVVQTSSFVLGEEVAQFESEFASYCGTAHTIAVGSGTAALSIMLQAAGVARGDEVVVPAHTFIASALAVVHAGAIPVCADVDPGTGLLDVAAARAAVGPRTAAVLAVHLYGQTCDMDGLRGLTDGKGLALFEDAAQAHGATCGGARTGGLGLAGAFSFYPTKNLGALGDGGAICTNDSEVAAAARRLRDLGRVAGNHEVPGYNERLDGLQAAWLRVKLPHLDAWNAARRSLADRYRRRLGDRAELLGERPEGDCVYHLFPIRVDDRDSVAEALRARGIEIGIHYPLSLPDQPALPSLSAADVPNARGWAKRELSLPLFPELAQRELDRVVETLDEVLSARHQ